MNRQVEDNANLIDMFRKHGSAYFSVEGDLRWEHGEQGDPYYPKRFTYVMDVISRISVDVGVNVNCMVNSKCDIRECSADEFGVKVVEPRLRGALEYIDLHVARVELKNSVIIEDRFVFTYKVEFIPF